jgi:hypothetical protein
MISISASALGLIRFKLIMQENEIILVVTITSAKVTKDFYQKRGA